MCVCINQKWQVERCWILLLSLKVPTKYCWLRRAIISCSCPFLINGPWTFQIWLCITFIYCHCSFFHLLLTSLNYTVVYVSMSTPPQDQRRLRQRWSTSRAPSEATLHHQPQPAFQPQHGSSASPSTQRPPHAPTQWPTPPVQPPSGTAALSPRRHGAGPPVQRRLQT